MVHKLLVINYAGYRSGKHLHSVLILAFNDVCFGDANSGLNHPCPKQSNCLVFMFYSK